MVNADAEGESEAEVLILDGRADPLHLRLRHVEPLLGIVLGRQEGYQVQGRQPRLSSKNIRIFFIIFKYINVFIYFVTLRSINIESVYFITK